MSRRKPIKWLGSSHRDLSRLPIGAKRKIGQQLDSLQDGLHPLNWKPMKNIDTSVTHVTPADGNVFADLGFEPVEAAKLKIKSGLMIQIQQWVRGEKLRQVDAAKILKITRPRLSDVMTGKIDKFTIDALVDMLENAGLHVTVHVA